MEEQGQGLRFIPRTFNEGVGEHATRTRRMQVEKPFSDKDYSTSLSPEFSYHVST